jgi:protein-S-isoprenylcysteine O-methyltransferase Ste14
MFNASELVSLCWIIFLGYWAIHWRSVKPTKETTWESQKIGWMIAWIIVIVYFLSPWGQQNFLNQTNLALFSLFKTTAAYIIGVIFLIGGLITAIVARKTLARNWSGNVELKEDHQLITTGVYKYIRHPIYTGVSFMGLGTFILYHSLLSLLFVLILVWFFMYKLKKEEVLLLKHFPKEYPGYIKKTKALIPFIY